MTVYRREIFEADIPEDILRDLEKLRPVKEIIAEIKKHPLHLDKDPEYIGMSCKAMFVEDLYAAMEAAGINKSQLAKRLGISRQSLGRIFSDSANVSLLTFARIAVALERNLTVRLYRRGERVSIRPALTQPADLLSYESPPKTLHSHANWIELPKRSIKHAGKGTDVKNPAA